MLLANWKVCSAIDSWPGEYIVVVSRDHVSAILARFGKFLETVAYIFRKERVVYRCDSSKTTNVSLPPSFEAAPVVDGRISPPQGKLTLVLPTRRPYALSAAR